MNLLSLPLEVIDFILSELELPSDLLSFAGTCHRVRIIAERAIDRCKQVFLSSAYLCYSPNKPGGRWMLENRGIWNRPDDEPQYGYCDTGVDLTAYVKRLTVSTRNRDSFPWSPYKDRPLRYAQAQHAILNQYPQLRPFMHKFQDSKQWFNDSGMTEALMLEILHLVLNCPQLAVIEIDALDPRMLGYMKTFLGWRLAVQTRLQDRWRSGETGLITTLPYELRLTVVNQYDPAERCLQLLTLPIWKRLCAMDWSVFDQKHDNLVDEWVSQTESRLEFVLLDRGRLGATTFAKFVRNLPHLVHIRVNYPIIENRSAAEFKATFLRAMGTDFHDRDLVWYQEHRENSIDFHCGEFRISKAYFLDEVDNNRHQDMVRDGWVTVRKGLTRSSVVENDVDDSGAGESDEERRT